MKKILFASIALASLAFAACNNNETKTGDHDMDSMKKEAAPQASAADEKDIKTVAVTYPNVDPAIAASIKEIVDHYLHVKNALANDNAAEAAAGSEAMSAVLGKINKAPFTPDQKKTYEENEEDLKEHAEHISKSKIDHQREHFSMMSEDVYALAKVFGGGKTLYQEFCPMYNDNKGARWLSETMEIRNPYFGSKMLECGKVEEKIQ